MARPKTKGDPLSFRLSKEAHEELVRRAAKAGVSPVEHLVLQLEKSLGGIEVPVVHETPIPPTVRIRGEHNEVGPKLKPADFLGVAGPQNATIECRHWRKGVENGKTICLQCGETL